MNLAQSVCISKTSLSINRQKNIFVNIQHVLLHAWSISYFFLIFRGQAIKDLLRTIVIHPLTTAQKAAQATISPAAQLLLSGADRGMFIVGAGEEEVFSNYFLAPWAFH